MNESKEKKKEGYLDKGTIPRIQNRRTKETTQQSTTKGESPTFSIIIIIIKRPHVLLPMFFFPSFLDLTGLTPPSVLSLFLKAEGQGSEARTK